MKYSLNKIEMKQFLSPLFSTVFPLFILVSVVISCRENKVQPSLQNNTSRQPEQIDIWPGAIPDSGLITGIEPIMMVWLQTCRIQL